MNFKTLLATSLVIGGSAFLGTNATFANQTDQLSFVNDDGDNIHITNTTYHIDESCSLYDVEPYACYVGDSLSSPTGTFSIERVPNTEVTWFLTVKNTTDQDWGERVLAVKTTDGTTVDYWSFSLAAGESKTFREVGFADGTLVLAQKNNSYEHEINFTDQDIIEKWSPRDYYQLKAGSDISFDKKIYEDMGIPNFYSLNGKFQPFFSMTSKYYTTVAPKIADWYSDKFGEDESLYLLTDAVDHIMFGAYYNYHFYFATKGKLYMNIEGKDYVFNNVGIAKGQEDISVDKFTDADSPKTGLWIISQYNAEKTWEDNNSYMVLHGKSLDNSRSVDLTLKARYHCYGNFRIVHCEIK